MSSPRSIDRGAPAWLLGIGIVLLALNMRVAVGSLGVVLDDVQAELGMSSTVAGVLTTIPVLCFAIFGSMAARISRAVGLDRAAVGLLAVLAAGLAARSVVNSTALFLILTVFSLAGCAVGNVLLPALTKKHFPDHVALLSSLYGAAVLAGASLSSVLTLPLSDGFGGWRPGIGLWALFALAALVPWVLPAIADRGTNRAHHDNPLRFADLVHSRLAWACALTLGAQSAQAYAQFGWFPAMLTDAGISPHRAGVFLALISAIGIPLTLLLPTLMARTDGGFLLPCAFAAFTVAGWAGVLWAPTTAPWLWAIMLGFGGLAFTWTLTMLGRRTRTHDGTAALSGFAQSIGYLASGIGPFGAGLLHDTTGSWTVPILFLMTVAVAIGVFGTIVSRGGMLEDELARG